MITALLFSLGLAQATTPEPILEVPAASAGEETPAAPAETPPEPDPLLGKVYDPTREWQVGPDSKYWELEVLYAQAKHLQGAELAEKLYAETKDPHLAVFIGRSWYQHLEGNEQITDKKERMQVYERALGFIEEGLEKNPDDAHLKFVYGVLMGRAGTTRGVLASLRYADDIENAWLDVLDSDFKYGSITLEEEIPCDTYLALGIFYRLVPDYWIVKALSGTRGDLDKSLEMQEKGVQCSGDRVRNLKELAVTQMCIGVSRKQPELVEAGRKSINRYLALEPHSQTEIVDMKHGILLLKDPSMACGYSRDGQQDLDKDKIPVE